MPALSPTMTEGNLSKWLIKKGDTVKAGDLIAEIETDKATMEVEAVDEGVVLDLLFKEGEANIPVNKAIAIIGDPNEKVEVKKEAPVEKVIEEKKIEKNIETKIENKKADIIDTPSPKIEEDTNLSSEEITMRQALRDTMAEEMRKDNKVFILGEEVAEYQGAYKVTQDLLQEFGKERVLDTPISEHGFTGLAVGAAFKGLRPILEFMTFNFSMQAIDQIINSAAKTLYMSGGQINCPIVFRGPNGAAAQVAAQHSQDFSSWYSQVPGLKVIAPSTPYNAKGLLRSAISDPNPVIFLENEILYGLKGPVNNDVNFSIPIGKANIEKEGKDLTIVTYSIMLQKSNEAALRLKEEYNLDAEIIDLQTLRPLDTETILNSVKKTNRLITVEESWPFGSVGSEIANIVQRDAFDYLDSPVIKVNSADVPMPYSLSLEKLYLPQVEDIINAAKLASCHEFIMELPAGYNSQIGERGTSMSGGQRQRIAIARTLLLKPKILIMDEATSALDYFTERNVVENLKSFYKDSTIFFITHRLATVSNADVIVMMEDGAVIEQGCHDSLIKNKGAYFSLYNQQESAEIT